MTAEQRSINVVVGETNDSFLSDIKRFAVTPEHVRLAIDALSQEVEEGAVGAGAGTRCFGFKGGIGTASRVIQLPELEEKAFTLGALVQTNYDGALSLYGRQIPRPEQTEEAKQGSCMIVLATDAPLNERQLGRIARRAVVGLTNTGSCIQHGSGEFVIAFSNFAGNLRSREVAISLRTELPEERLDAFFEATVEAVQEAVYNSLTMAREIVSSEGTVVPALDLSVYELPAVEARPARNDRRKTIGIIGGMGPKATADLFEKVIAETKAESDKGHLHVLIDNDPSIPDRTAAILEGGVDPLPALTRSAKLLQGSGADLLLIPCNTAHYFFDAVQNSVSIPILNMLAITAKACRKSGYRAVGLLSTTGTAKSGVYEAALRNENVDCITPEQDEMETLMRYIYRYKAGQAIAQREPLLEIIRHLKARGAEAIVLGCTELPMITDGIESPLPLIDPTLLLAKAAVKAAEEE
jgi:aspartate racemase